MHIVNRMTEMLRLSAEVHEKIIRQIVPEATDEQVDFVVYNYPQINSFYYPHWWDGLRESFVTEIDKVYEGVARLAIDFPNPLEIVVAAEIDMFGRERDVDLLDYYIIKYVNTHVHAVSLA